MVQNDVFLHKNQMNISFCINKSDGKFLTLNDIIPHAYIRDAKIEIIQKLCKEFHVDNEQQLAGLSVLFDLTSELPANFILHDSFITILFNQDELTSLQKGIISIDIKRFS